jgi:hypothetical protein
MNEATAIHRDGDGLVVSALAQERAIRGKAMDLFHQVVDGIRRAERLKEEVDSLDLMQKLQASLNLLAAANVVYRERASVVMATSPARNDNGKESP